MLEQALAENEEKKKVEEEKPEQTQTENEEKMKVEDDKLANQVSVVVSVCTVSPLYCK